MRIILICLGIVLTQSAAHAIPIIQHFAPQPEIEVPARVAGADAQSLKAYEVELALRLQRNPDDPYISHKLGTVLYHQGRVDEAKRAWQRASEQEPNLAPADLMADLEEVFALLAEDEVEPARKKIKAVEKKYAGNPHFHLSRGEQAMRGGNLEEAGKAYRKAYGLAPELYTTSLNLARYHEFRQEHPTAREYYLKAVKLAPERAENWRLLGSHQFLEGRMNAALKSFRKAKEADDDEPLPEVRMARLSYEIRDYIGARHWYRTALAEKPANADAIRVALSDVQLRLGLLDEARGEIEIALSKMEILPLLVAMAVIEESRGKPGSAETYYRRALKMQPSNVIAANNLAMLLVRMDKSPEEALELAETANKGKPNNAQILGTYACALYRAGKLEEAGKMLSQAVRLSPGDVWVRYFYGKLLLEQKRPEEARVHLEGVLILEPGFSGKTDVEKLLQRADQ